MAFMEDRTRPFLPQPTPPPLQAIRRSAPDAEIIALSGDMALSTVDTLRDALEEEVVRSTNPRADHQPAGCCLHG
jgi:hypothetical protein